LIIRFHFEEFQFLLEVSIAFFLKCNFDIVIAVILRTYFFPRLDKKIKFLHNSSYMKMMDKKETTKKLNWDSLEFTEWN